MELVWGSAPYPGIYRAGASPETEYRQRYPAGSVLAPESALGSLPSVALSSVQAVDRIIEFLEFSVKEDH